MRDLIILDRLLFWTAADLENETLRLPKLLQSVSRSHVARESDSDSHSEIQRCQSQTVPVAETLSRFIPNANSCMNTNSPSTPANMNHDSNHCQTGAATAVFANYTAWFPRQYPPSCLKNKSDSPHPAAALPMTSSASSAIHTFGIAVT
jgi:hypothetical protein